MYVDGQQKKLRRTPPTVSSLPSVQHSWLSKRGVVEIRRTHSSYPENHGKRAQLLFHLRYSWHYSCCFQPQSVRPFQSTNHAEQLVEQALLQLYSTNIECISDDERREKKGARLSVKIKEKNYSWERDRGTGERVFQVREIRQAEYVFLCTESIKKQKDFLFSRSLSIYSSSGPSVLCSTNKTYTSLYLVFSCQGWLDYLQFLHYTRFFLQF